MPDLNTPKLNLPLLHHWAESIPSTNRSDITQPEWKPTPIFPLNLGSIGYEQVFVKDESDSSCNPTGTVKDRAAWEMAKLYRDFSRTLLGQLRDNYLCLAEVEKIDIPRISIITAGNEGIALARCFEKYRLPKPKAIVDAKISTNTLKILHSEYLEVYPVDLSKTALSRQQMKEITRNDSGMDLTSMRSFQPSEIFYDWHVHEAFNFQPDDIFLPYGSGRLFENYLAWQCKSIRNSHAKTPDPRLNCSIEKISKMNLTAAEPSHPHSIADKLSSPFKPFKGMDSTDISDQKSFRMTGEHTRVDLVPEEFLLEAKKILNEAGIMAEYSGAAGLALFLYVNHGKPKTDRKTLIINTGCGVTAKQSA